MERRQKLLLGLMVRGLMLFYGVTATAALTPSEIKEIANDSMVLLSIIDGHGKRWTGSGFVVHEDHIATNYHVVEDMLIGRAKLIGKKEWRFFIGPILKFDKEHDLAIVQVAGINAPALRLGDSDKVKIDDPIYVAGNPSGPEGRVMEGTVTIGEIKHILTEHIRMGGKSLRGKKLQIDASIEPGSSGGPVLNESAEVIGISVGGYTGVEGEEYIPLGYNYAIAVNHLKQLAKRAGIPITSAPVGPTIKPPIMKHNPPSRVSVGERIPLTLDLTSSKAPRQVTIFYKTYDRGGNELAPKIKSQKMRLWDEQLTSSTRTYRANLPPQRRVGSIIYYIEVEYDNSMAFRDPRDLSRHYQISMVDDIPPTISVLSPDEGEQFTADQQITVRAEVMDNSVVEEVHLHILSPNSQNQKLFKAVASDIYTTDISFSQVGTVEYYLTAIDEAKKKSRSENRRLTITLSDTTPPTIRLIHPRDGTTFEVGQQIPIEAEVTDNTSVGQVRLSYGFSLAISDEPTHYSDEFLTETALGTYTGHIPPQNQSRYIKYYLTATDKAGNRSISENRRLTITPPDTTPPIIRLRKPSRTTFEVGQQIPIEAEVTDGTSIEQVRLFYGFSLAISDEPTHYSDEFLTETALGTYTGYIPPQSQSGYIEYYLTATDNAGNESISESRQLDIRHPPPPRSVRLDKAIKLYEQARYDEAIEVLEPAIRELKDPGQQAEAYLYLGASKRGVGASNDEVKAEFRKAISLNSNQELPIRVGNDHPIFAELLEEVRIELIGESIIVEPVSPSRVSVGETILPILKLNSPLAPQQVKIYYTIYDKDGNELKQNNQEMRVRDRETASSTWSYEVELPPQKRIGLIEYYIEIGYENQVAFKYPREQSDHYPISIFDDKPPAISVLSPSDGERFTIGDQTTVSAEVVDNGIVGEVRIYVLGPNAQNQELFKEKSSDMYTKDITLSQVGIVEYYLTATDEAGKESRSENRWLTIDPKPPRRPTHPTIHLIKPSSTTFHVNQQIPIEAKVTDDTSVEQVRLFYSFSPSISESPRYSEKPLTETLSDTYTGHIPPQSKAGYIWYYLSATDEAGNKSTSENRWLEITTDIASHPVIRLIQPREGTPFEVGQQIPVEAEVTDDTSVEQVRLFYSFSPSISEPPHYADKSLTETSSSMYTGYIPPQNEAGYIWYYLSATDDGGKESRLEPRWIDIRLGPDGGNGGEESDPEIKLLDPLDGAEFEVNQRIAIRAEVIGDTPIKEVLVHFGSGNSQKLSAAGSSGRYSTSISFSHPGSVEFHLTATDEAGKEDTSESRHINIRSKPPPLQGIWASVAADTAAISVSDGSYMFRLAYLREGKNRPTLGAQLDFSPDRTHMSAIFQWGPALGESKVAFTLLGGIAEYEDSPRSTHTTPIFGGGLKFYPRDRIVIDATGSFKLRSDYDTTDLYHYEVGIRYYIPPELGLRAGYGKLYLGDKDVTTLQIGIGVNF